MSLQPLPTVNGAHHWYPVVEQVRTCRLGFQALERPLQQLHHDNLRETDKEREQLLLCKDVHDRFEMWCASFNIVHRTFDRGLRKSMGIAGIVFRLFDRILALLDTSRQTLLSPRSWMDKYNRVGQHLHQLRHLVEKLIELSPALEAPALSTVSQTENATGGYTLADFDLARDPLSQPTTSRFEKLQDYKTLFLISNSVALQGWRWDMAAQLLYQSARRLPQMVRNMDGAPEVRFAFSIPGQQETKFGIEDALSIFCRSVPRGLSFETSVLDECLSSFASKVTYSSEKPLSLLIFTADGIGHKARTMERLILEVGKKMKVTSTENGQVIIRFVQLGANPFITRDVNWLKAAINNDQAILGIIEVELLVIEGATASELTYEQLLLRGNRDLSLPSMHSLDSDSLNIPWSLVVNNLTNYTDVGILQICFEVYGPLDDVRIESTANAAVFAALISYRRRMDAELACDALNNTRFDGSIIRVHLQAPDQTFVNLTQREDRSVASRLDPTSR